MVMKGVIAKYYVEPCSHEWGPLSEEGTQQCVHCNIVHRVPCRHKWEKTDEHTVSRNGRIVKLIKVYNCTECGDEKKHEVNAD